MKVVVDMNLTPAWVGVFTHHGIECVHWSSVGSPSAPDSEIVKWAVENEHVVFTHDLDFGAILAASHANAPSVIQIRTQDVLPDVLGPFVISAVQQFQSLLEAGALIVVDRTRSRARVLPVVR